MKILNLYSCLGGNRFKWDEINKNLEITAVEIDSEAARLYKQRFPKDNVIIDDAHNFLLENYKFFDFIWSSPPCPSHSRARFWRSKGNICKPVYPEMNLYQEIIFLNNYFKGKFCVENVIPFYEPLIPAQKRGRHLYWTNFVLPNILSNRNDVAIKRGKNELKNLCEFHNFDFTKYKGEQRIDKMARNLVDFEAGKTILEIAIGIIKQNNTKQTILNF